METNFITSKPEIGANHGIKIFLFQLRHYIIFTYLLTFAKFQYLHCIAVKCPSIEFREQSTQTFENSIPGFCYAFDEIMNIALVL